MRTTRSVVAALVAAAALAAAGCSGGAPEQGCETTDGVLRCPPEARAAAPRVAGELLEGGRYDLAEQRGQVVVVNFWGSWCAPCRAEIDDLEQVYQATKASGVRFLGVNIRDDRDKAKQFQAGRVTYPSLFDPSSSLALEFDIPPNATPATIVLDREGRIARVIRRAVHRDALQPIVAEVAAETESR
jgi:thiol-disulfide isomerase/thioredoxin